MACRPGSAAWARFQRARASTGLDRRRPSALYEVARGGRAGGHRARRTSESSRPRCAAAGSAPTVARGGASPSSRAAMGGTRRASSWAIFAVCAVVPVCAGSCLDGRHRRAHRRDSGLMYRCACFCRHGGSPRRYCESSASALDPAASPDGERRVGMVHARVGQIVTLSTLFADTPRRPSLGSGRPPQPGTEANPTHFSPESTWVNPLLACRLLGREPEPPLQHRGSGSRSLSLARAAAPWVATLHAS